MMVAPFRTLSLTVGAVGAVYTREDGRTAVYRWHEPERAEIVRTNLNKTARTVERNRWFKPGTFVGIARIKAVKPGVFGTKAVRP